MKCNKIKKLISKYFDHQTNQQETNNIFDHIKICSLCEKEFNLLSTIYKNLPQYDNVEISDEFNTKLFTRLSEEKHTKYNLNIFDFVFFNRGFKKILIPVVSIFLIILGTMFISYSKNRFNDYSTYELYPQEDVDLAMIDFFINYIE